jgi:hypothetical protein
MDAADSEKEAVATKATEGDETADSEKEAVATKSYC